MKLASHTPFSKASRGWLRASAWLVLVIFLVQVPGANALSEDQKHVYNEGINYYEVAVDDSCDGATAGTTGGTTGGAVTADMTSFVSTYGEFALNVGKANGIPYDAILAQASLESNYGQSQLTQQANNFFGIKAAAGWTGATVTFPTEEQTASGGVYTVNATFEAYPNAQAGFQGYVDFLKRNQRYTNVFNYQHNAVGYFQALKDDGYATDTQYVQKLSSRLSAVDQAITASAGKLPPESQVVYDVQPPAAGSTGATASSSGSTCASSGTGNGTGVVAIALGEIGNHYAKYTNGRQENWCADFVSWVYKSAGKPFTAAPGVGLLDGWQIQSVENMKTYLQAKGQFFLNSPTAPAPQPGDIVIYQNGMSHTNIVAEANGYMVKTVGGNQESNNLTESVVSESKNFIDIRNDTTVTGWGRLP